MPISKMLFVLCKKVVQVPFHRHCTTLLLLFLID